MEINSITAYQPVQPNKPSAPTPPPGGNIENRQPPSEPSAPSRPTDIQANDTSNSNGVNYSTLRSLQEILGNYSDVSSLGNEKRNELTSRLQDAGLLEPGALLDTTA